MARSHVQQNDRRAADTFPITMAITVLWLLLHRVIAEIVHYMDGVIGRPIGGPFA